VFSRKRLCFCAGCAFKRDIGYHDKVTEKSRLLIGSVHLRAANRCHSEQRFSDLILSLPPAYKPMLHEEGLQSGSSGSKLMLLKNNCQKHDLWSRRGNARWFMAGGHRCGLPFNIPFPWEDRGDRFFEISQSIGIVAKLWRVWLRDPRITLILCPCLREPGIMTICEENEVRCRREELRSRIAIRTMASSCISEQQGSRIKLVYLAGWWSSCCIKVIVLAPADFGICKWFYLIPAPFKSVSTIYFVPVRTRLILLWRWLKYYSVWKQSSLGGFTVGVTCQKVWCCVMLLNIRFRYV
jgi:hypothetical protein